MCRKCAANGLAPKGRTLRQRAQGRPAKLQARLRPLRFRRSRAMLFRRWAGARETAEQWMLRGSGAGRDGRHACASQYVSHRRRHSGRAGMAVKKPS